MNKLIAISFIIIFIQKAYAAPVEGPNMPNPNFWKTGLQTNIIFGADIKNPKGKLKSNQYFLTGSFGITEWLCFDGKLGIGGITFDIKDSQKIEHPFSFAGGYGGRILLYDDKNSGINYILGLHHISVHPDYTKIGGKKYEAILDEWQASLLVSKRLKFIQPYIAGKFSKIYLIRTVDDSRKRLRPEDEWGLVIGTDLNINNNARFNIEGRFFDEESLTVGFNYTF